MQIFRESAEFQDLMEEEAVDGLIRGFEDFRAQVRRISPKLDLSGLQPRLGVAGDNSAPGSPEDDSALDSAPESPKAETEHAVVEAETGAAKQVACEVPSREAVGGAPKVAPESAPEVAPEAAPEVAHEAAHMAPPEVSTTSEAA